MCREAATSPEMVDKAAQPMLEALKRNPKDSDTLAKVGNLYYDSQLYAKAIEYYRQALKITPGNPDIRTDMGTAMFYLGDSDKALAEFEKSLSYEPNHPNTLFNCRDREVAGQERREGRDRSLGAVAEDEPELSGTPESGGIAHSRQRARKRLGARGRPEVPRSRHGRAWGPRPQCAAGGSFSYPSSSFLRS